MKILAFIILVIFAVFGFSEFLHIVRMFLIFPQKKVNTKVVIELQNGIAEKQLLYVCEQYNWYGKYFADAVYVNTDNLDEENYNNCKAIAKKYDIEI